MNVTGTTNRTIERPYHMFQQWKQLSRPLAFAVLFGAFVASALAAFWVFVELGKGWWPAAAALSCLAVISFVVFVLVVITVSRLTGDGAPLVKRWHAVVCEDLTCFPRDGEELASVGDDLRRVLANYADSLTVCFDERKEAQDNVERVKALRPALLGLVSVALHDLPDTRDKIHAANQKAEEGYLKTLNDAVSRFQTESFSADNVSRQFFSCWDIVKDLGAFYGVNVLPLGLDGVAFSDPDEFRKHLKTQNTQIPGDPMPEVASANVGGATK